MHEEKARRIRNNLVGMKFGRLTVVSLSSDRGNGKKPVTKWNCVCECGNKVVVTTNALKTGHTVSCGCKKIKHHRANKERLYQTWCNMRNRCRNKNRPDWKRYGGKGITICPEWDDYAVFREWALSNGYNDNLTIDRIDSNGNYCPENCRWVDYKVQANNISRNHIIEYQGEKKTMAEWADYFGLSYSAMQHRVERGWSMDRIASQKQRSW